MEDLTQSARIRWQIRRGMLELDTLLSEFYEKKFHHLDADQKKLFEVLLEQTDADLYRWFMGVEEPGVEKFKPLVKMIRNDF